MEFNGLMSGALGGLLVLGADVVFRRVEAGKQLQRELEGLLSILFFEEIAPTYFVANRFIENPSQISSSQLPLLKNQMWVEVRLRIAQLTTKRSDLLIALLTYYSTLEVTRTYLELAASLSERHGREQFEQKVLKEVRKLQTQYSDVEGYIKAIIITPDDG